MTKSQDPSQSQHETCSREPLGEPLWEPFWEPLWEPLPVPLWEPLPAPLPAPLRAPLLAPIGYLAVATLANWRSPLIHLDLIMVAKSPLG